MAVGAVTKYNQFLDVIMGAADRQWDDATTGSAMFILATNAYTPVATHTTAANLSGVIASGDGGPVNVSSPAINNSSGTTWINSGNADFGTPITVTAKYLICRRQAIPRLLSALQERTRRPQAAQ